MPVSKIIGQAIDFGQVGFVYHPTTISANVTIIPDRNVISAGPVTLNSNVVIEIAATSKRNNNRRDRSRLA